MPNNYQFLDAYSSVQTAASSVVSGAHQPLVQIASVLSPIPTTFSGSPSISGAVTIVGTPTVNIGTIPGSTLAVQGTSPWNISSIYGNISGSVVAQVSNFPTNQNVSGSVLSQQSGTRVSSVLNSTPSSLLTGNYGHRNDAVASYLGGNLTWTPKATDSAGRTLIRPFAAEESRIEGYVSTTNTSVTTVVGTPGAGLRNYITDIWFANTGSVATLVTLSSQGGASILGYTIAPATSGSNLPGLAMPIRSGVNETFDIQAASPTSTLYATVKGFKAP